MQTLTFWIFGLSIAWLIVESGNYFEKRDAILRELYEKEKEFWIKIGRPRGRHWRPTDDVSESWGWSDRRVWQSISKMEMTPSIREIYSQQRVIGKRLVFLDLPCLVGMAFLVAMVFSMKQP